MLCTERRPVLLLLMVYLDSELLEPRHVRSIENEVVTVSYNQWKGVSGSLGPPCRGSSSHLQNCADDGSAAGASGASPLIRRRTRDKLCVRISPAIKSEIKPSVGAA